MGLAEVGKGTEEVIVSLPRLNWSYRLVAEWGTSVPQKMNVFKRDLHTPGFVHLVLFEFPEPKHKDGTPGDPNKRKMTHSFQAPPGAGWPKDFELQIRIKHSPSGGGWKPNIYIVYRDDDVLKNGLPNDAEPVLLVKAEDGVDQNYTDITLCIYLRT